MNFKFHIYGLILLFLCGCSPALSGKLENNRYTSAEGRFSLPVPVDLSSGGNGSIIDSGDEVTFTYMVDGEFYVKSFSHSKHITPENKQSVTKEALITIADPKLIVLHEEYIPSIKNGTTFNAYASNDNREGEPSVIGVGAFWTKTRFIFVVAGQSSSALFLADDKSENNQISMVKRLLIDVLKSVDVNEE